MDPGAALAQAMGAAVGGKGDEEVFAARLKELFTERGFCVVDDPKEADYAYLHVWPISNGMVFRQYAMPVIEMVDEELFEEREVNQSQKKTGKMVKKLIMHICTCGRSATEWSFASMQCQ